jgi:hypothetical protein
MVRTSSGITALPGNFFKKKKIIINASRNQRRGEHTW